MKRLSIRKLTKQFENGNNTLTINNLSLEVFDNEITVIVGPSGCGKTTLINLVAGFIQPTQGAVILNNQKKEPQAGEIGVLFQEPQLFSWLTVEKNIQFGPKIKSRSINIDELLSLVKLEGFENHYPSMLSRGMQQRVALARALVIKPKFLLMDEPFSSLDILTKQKMQELILKIHKETKIPIVFITHDIEEALFLAHKIWIMTKSPGRIKAMLSNPLSKNRFHDIKYTEEFISLKRKIEQMMKEEVQDDN